MSNLNTLFDQFLRERVYLHNITPRTRDFYVTAWKAFVRSQATAPPRAPETPVLTRAHVQYFVMHLRERGVKPVTCNCWLRGINAFGKWLHEQGVIPNVVRLAQQKLEKRIIGTHDEVAFRLPPRRFLNLAKWRTNPFTTSKPQIRRGIDCEEEMTPLKSPS